MEMYMACRLNTVRTCYHQINLDNRIFNAMLPKLVTRQKSSALVKCWMQTGLRFTKKQPGSVSAAHASIFWITSQNTFGLQRYAGINSEDVLSEDLT